MNCQPRCGYYEPMSQATGRCMHPIQGPSGYVMLAGDMCEALTGDALQALQDGARAEMDRQPLPAPAEYGRDAPAGTVDDDVARKDLVRSRLALGRRAIYFAVWLETANRRGRSKAEPDGGA